MPTTYSPWSSSTSTGADWLKGGSSGTKASGIATTKKTPFSFGNSFKDAQAELADLMSRLGSGGGSAGPVAAPYLDIGSLNKRALEMAKTKVNPYFDQERKLFLGDVERRRSAAKQDTEFQQQEIQTLLDEFLQDTEINRTRTSEDVEGNLGELGQAEGMYQETEAEKAGQERTSVADAIADAGLTTSGLGRQKIAELQKNRNRESKENLRQIDVKKQEQHQFKTRTFEDLAKGETRKKDMSERELKVIKHDLTVKLGNLAYEKVTGLRQNEVRRKEELARQQKTYGSQEYTKFISGLGGNTQLIEAANRAYGGLF